MLKPRNKIQEVKMRDRVSEARFNSVWLIRWGFHSQDENKQLEKIGIKNKVVDFLNGRKKFEDVHEYVENLYKLYRLSFSEKASLENYHKGRKNRKEIFGKTIPVSTSYQGSAYRDWVKYDQQNRTSNEERDVLVQKFINSPQYIIIGHNPYLEGVLVYNFSIFNENGVEVLEWEERLVDGSLITKKYKEGL